MSEQIDKPIAEWFVDHVRLIREADGRLAPALHRRTLHNPMTNIARELGFSYKKVRRLVAEIRQLLAEHMSDG